MNDGPYHPPLLNLAEQGQLLDIARSSILSGLKTGQALDIDLSTVSSSALREQGAAFVTLEKRGQLRGCIGSVEAYRPLVEDVAENAWFAAFGDPRFPKLTQVEYQDLTLEISVLTQPESITVESEEVLKNLLVPGEDGLILQDGHQRALFLPAVWEKLPEVEMFISHLKQKAGMASDHWSDSMEVKRFHSFEFSDHHV